MRVRVIPFPNPQFRNELKDIRVCWLELINWATRILVKHCNWKWLLSSGHFTHRGKDLGANHCSIFPILDLEWVEAQNVHKKTYFLKSKISVTPKLKKKK